ncbi:pyruvate kinase [Roseiconus nitratireducens]|uniref:Pyruvate kinase n=1 Tax=Roseiconus nitratireducens TaxID=2605748 RepID=A0A5M6DB27_9BACT|nr:pyruvate kinase [Roseiconus nitratireducens]KAA5544573.1 pyruvate kinase [Roseiconus nitratireducens]
MPRPSLDQSCTKIVATVGPACDTPEKLAELIEAGADVFRINTAHGKIPDHEQKLAAIREASAMTGVHVGVLLDLAGPKIRLGELVNEPLQCDVGMQLTFIRRGEPKTDHELTSTYGKLIDELTVGNRVMLADGMVALEVESVSADRAVCRVTAAGELRSRQGINLPGVKLSVSAMQRNDLDNAIWAADHGIDFISLSFVRTAEDVRTLKNVLTAHDCEALVIAKIEKPEALANLEQIVDAADGIMVARGDLGVEIDVAETPMAQKRIIRVCKEKVKPVIVATQMLESMHHSPRPTRAEASDVANAILDGADACMLSGETAIGDFPVKTVQMMSRIMQCTEQSLTHDMTERTVTNRVHPITTAVTFAATNIAEAIDASLIVIATKSGGTAWVKSKSRSLIPTLGASDCEETLRRMNLFWGIKPIAIKKMGHPAEIRTEICRWGKKTGVLKVGDRIVFVSGSGVVEKAHNSVVVHTVD